MSFKRRQQLNDEETRIYAAGMNAARRGERRPKQELPFEQYKLWRAGWNRVGRTLKNFTPTRNVNHNNLCQSAHFVRTEVEDFDDALWLLQKRKQAKAAGATQAAKPTTWRQELIMHGARMKSPKGRGIAPAQAERVSEFERHIVGRVITAIESLKLGVEEMSAISAMGQKFPAVNPKALMDIVGSLCKLIKLPVPEYNVHRTPIQHQPRLCVQCGTPLESGEMEYCRHCNPETESLRIASEMRREYHANLAGLMNEADQISKLINKVTRKVIEHDDGEGHSGRPSQADRDMEAGGREENLVVGSETPHQSGESGTGDTEG